ncbi:sulfatase-like hydrolase/transferase [Paenibacillus mesophilus]|uniref:sulfatase-like hydrolase/transferase n=1 Tax=Paenibacillus mesophilus TaxID=2582849 RepID=UPI001EE3A673|nr:sulfatase-like hydrolase/transferase [Paenibacillus mesophilus]
MEQRGQRPNIVFILSDDQGAWAMGNAGNREIITPNLDRLAETGIRFDNFFCASPVCSPARASLMTGKIPSQHGVHDWIREGNVGERAVPYLQGHRTYVEELAENGYVCGLSGKWHLGDNQKAAPGFSFWYAHQTGGSPYYNAPMVRDGQLYNEPGYVTDVITDEALRFLDAQNGGQPFYLSVHYTAPHSPWIGNHPEEIVRMYDDCPFESCPQEPKHPWSIPNPPWGEDWKANLKGYYAAVTAMDLQIGRILDKLEQMGERNNTLVVFMSDNGFSCGQHGFWGKGNGTFPQNMYDSSVKVPAIFSHPGHIPEGVVSDALLSAYDFMPTILEYAGIGRRSGSAVAAAGDSSEGSSASAAGVLTGAGTGARADTTANTETDGAAGTKASTAAGIPDGMPPQYRSLPGRSFSPLLTGQPHEVRDDVVVYDEYGPVRMVRSKTRKYIHRYPYGPHELYDLAADPVEKRNLAYESSYAETLTAMKAKLDDWFVRYADPAVDGTREPVTGAGQLGLAGVRSQGAVSFAQLNRGFAKP